ncbi:unnamed protein product [Musa banksii]
MDSANGVFYDEAQVHNRDISIAVLRTSISKPKEEHAIMLSRKGLASEVPCDRPSDYLSDGDCQIQLDSSEYTKGNLREIQEIPASKVQELKAPTVLELKYFLVRNLQALAASGLRSRRYALEIDGIGKIVALDYDEFYMLTHPKEFDAVELDPYGSPSAFLDSAVQSIADGGLLMCTATGLSVLCDMGNRYGSYPLKAKYHHDMTLRMLLACVESHANRYRHYIVLIMSVPMDFYMQVFVHIFTSRHLKLSYIYQCAGCDSFHLQSLGRTVTKVSYQLTVDKHPAYKKIVAVLIAISEVDVIYQNCFSE